MKGSMIFSLITLCVVMLFIEDRISDFLHGGSEPVREEQGLLPEMDFLSDWGDALAGFWRDGTDFLASLSGAVADKPDDDKVVITEDTIQQVWVWREKGAIQSARQKPSHPRARQVMIPENMTAAEFFGDNTTNDSSGTTTEPADQTAKNSRDKVPATEEGTPDPDGANTGTPLDQLSPEQRRAMLEQGMEVLQQQPGDLGGRSMR